MKTNTKNVSKRKQSNNDDKNNQNSEKKTFDKKKYRLQKYSNKYKVAQWEERRKKAILRNFYKDLDKEQKKKEKKPFPLKNDKENEDAHKTQSKKISAFHKAKKEFYLKKQQKRREKEEALQIKSEKSEALKKYKEKRMQNYKKLSKQTKRGQPVMKDRLEMLLEKIQQQV